VFSVFSRVRISCFASRHIWIRVFAFFQFLEMVEGVRSVVTTYKERLMGMLFVPKTSFGRAALGVDGAANNYSYITIYLPSESAFGST
jgi:hypothetical protein